MVVPDSDPRSVLVSSDEANVRSVLADALAVVVHGSELTTVDFAADRFTKGHRETCNPYARNLLNVPVTERFVNLRRSKIKHCSISFLEELLT